MSREIKSSKTTPEKIIGNAKMDISIYEKEISKLQSYIDELKQIATTGICTHPTKRSTAPCSYDKACPVYNSFWPGDNGGVYD